MTNATNHKDTRLSATVWGVLLEPFITEEVRYMIPIQGRDGALKLKVDYLQARVLNRYGMIFGSVRKGNLRYLVARVPIHVMVRVLHMDPPKTGEISKPKRSDMRWSTRFDRAKGGRMSGMTSFGGFYHTNELAGSRDRTSSPQTAGHVG